MLLTFLACASILAPAPGCREGRLLLDDPAPLARFITAQPTIAAERPGERVIRFSRESPPRRRSWFGSARP